MFEKLLIRDVKDVHSAQCREVMKWELFVRGGINRDVLHVFVVFDALERVAALLANTSMCGRNVLGRTWLLVPVCDGIRAVTEDVERKGRLMVGMESRETAVANLAVEFYHRAHDGLHGVHGLQRPFAEIGTDFGLADGTRSGRDDGGWRCVRREQKVWALGEVAKMLLFRS